MLSAALEQWREQAHAVIEANPHHDLPAVSRCTLYSILVSSTTENGWGIRSWLDVITARHVAFAWDRVWPDNPLVLGSLRTAESVIAGSCTREFALRIAQSHWGHLDELSSEPDEGFEPDTWFDPLITAACLAGYAAVRALYTACSIDSFEGIDWEATENYPIYYLDPWSADTAQWAGLVIGGDLCEPVSDAAARFRFWEWWLDEALPAAWEAGQRTC